MYPDQLIYFLFVSIQCLECFERISDGSLSDIIIPSDQKNIKIEDSKDQIETETDNSQGDETFINNDLEEPGKDLFEPKLKKVQPFQDHFWPFFCQLYEYLSQN